MAELKHGQGGLQTHRVWKICEQGVHSEGVGRIGWEARLARRGLLGWHRVVADTRHELWRSIKHWLAGEGKTWQPVGH